MEEVFKCMERRMIWEYDGWIKSQAWGCPCHPKTYPISTSIKSWGWGIPFFINKNIRSSFKTLYFYCFIWYVLFLEGQLFLFFSLFCFVCCSLWLDPRIFCLERFTLRFHCLEHSSFHSYCFVSVQFSLVLCLAHGFHSYFLQSLLVCFSYVWLSLWSLLNISYESCFKEVEWCWRREKYFMLIVVQWGASIDCGLDFTMSC